MLQRTGMLLFAVAAIWGSKSTQAAAANAPLEVAPSVDLARYAGKWYEIARLQSLPARLREQHHCDLHAARGRQDHRPERVPPDRREPEIS